MESWLVYILSDRVIARSSTWAADSWTVRVNGRAPKARPERELGSDTVSNTGWSKSFERKRGGGTISYWWPTERCWALGAAILEGALWVVAGSWKYSRPRHAFWTAIGDLDASKVRSRWSARGGAPPGPFPVGGPGVTRRPCSTVAWICRPRLTSLVPPLYFRFTFFGFQPQFLWIPTSIGSLWWSRMVDKKEVEMKWRWFNR